jgi:Uma2 family endonuclease
MQGAAAMGKALRQHLMGVDDFLAWDATQDARRELVRGEVFAMAGAEDRHVMVCGNVYMALRQHLAGSRCRAYMADMKVRVESDSSIFYPDVMVTCSEADRSSPLVKSEPLLVVEVLSPSTAAHDRGSKFASYRMLASLSEYVLVDLDTRRTDVYRKNDAGLWVLHPFGPNEAVTLASVDLSIPLDQLFAEVDDLPPPGG